MARVSTQSRCRCGTSEPSPGADVASTDHSCRIAPIRKQAPLCCASKPSNEGRRGAWGAIRASERARAHCMRGWERALLILSIFSIDLSTYYVEALHRSILAPGTPAQPSCELARSRGARINRLQDRSTAIRQHATGSMKDATGSMKDATGCMKDATGCMKDATGCMKDATDKRAPPTTLTPRRSLTACTASRANGTASGTKAALGALGEPGVMRPLPR